MGVLLYTHSMRNNTSLISSLFWLVSSGLILKYLLSPLFQADPFIAILASTITLALGAFFTLPRAANMIESTTEILSKNTGLAAGLLQSLGTAFPDMILGVTAAIVSLNLINIDYERAINFAMIAAATTFGSNIYNIGHAAWCIWRQNQADFSNKKILMFPFSVHGGYLTPLNQHKRKPSIKEIDIATRLLTILTLLTASVALAMVAFGQVTPTLYQLIQPAGVGLFLITGFVLYSFRHNTTHNAEADSALSDSPLSHHASLQTFASLLAAGLSIAFAAESMVHALELIGSATHIPYVVMGALAGVIGCLGEMLVIHNYSIHRNGRLGDAIVGVTMDNIVTIMGASLVSIMGGIFLGGTSLITLFVIILALNTILMDQISRLKTTLATLLIKC